MRVKHKSRTLHLLIIIYLLNNFRTLKRNTQKSGLGNQEAKYHSFVGFNLNNSGESERGTREREKKMGSVPEVFASGKIFFSFRNFPIVQNFKVKEKDPSSFPVGRALPLFLLRATNADKKKMEEINIKKFIAAEDVTLSAVGNELEASEATCGNCFACGFHN